MIKLKRIYEEYSHEDGYRVLVDRLWPRGVAKKDAHIDLWLKDIAPSNELRKWFGHEEKKWDEFQKKYKEELKNSLVLSELNKIVSQKKVVTLLYGAKNEKYNQAQVLLTLL